MEIFQFLLSIIKRRLMGPNLEIEIKFYLYEIESVKTIIISMGGISLGRYFETNLSFDDEHASLYQNKCLLRLRKDQNSKLTFKKPSDVSDRQFKTLKELEIEVSDFEQTRAILNALGFYEVQRYEKWRETFRIGNTLLMIDTMPYGHFLEIEGGKSDIRYLAGKIGLIWDERILANYLEIFAAIKRNMGLKFNDVTFELFSGISKDYSGIIQSFQKSGKLS